MFFPYSKHLDHHWSGRYITLVGDSDKWVNYATVNYPASWGHGIVPEFSLDNNGMMYWRDRLLAGFENNSEHDYRSPLVFGSRSAVNMYPEAGFSFDRKGRLELHGDDKWYVCQNGDKDNLTVNWGRGITRINPNCHSAVITQVWR